MTNGANAPATMPVPLQMYKARTRDLYADVNTKLSEMCGWDTHERKFKPREGKPQDTPGVICTSPEVADKVVRASFRANISSDNLSGRALRMLLMLVRFVSHRRWPC